MTPQDFPSSPNRVTPKNGTKYNYFTKLYAVKLIPFAIALFFLIAPRTADASFLNLFSAHAAADTTATPILEDSTLNSQNMPLLKASISPSTEATHSDVAIVAGNSVSSDSGPMGTMGNIEDQPSSHQISTYIVRENDTVGGIAKMFNVSASTVMWANDLKSKTLKEGQTLVILPVSGVLHTVKAGETVKSIANKYKADIDEVAQYNDIATDEKLTVGDILTIPDGEIAAPPVVILNKLITSKSSAKITVDANGYSSGAHDTNGPYYPGYYMRPVTNAVKTQGLHGFNGVDLAAPLGTPIYASAGGKVIVATTGGYNGGYGNYIVISHPNGTQTLYGHTSKVLVSVGQMVDKGDLIGKVGATGKATGPHLHFEIRGAKNPF